MFVLQCCVVYIARSCCNFKRSLTPSLMSSKFCLKVDERQIHKNLTGHRMVEFSISNARYTYVHDQKYPSENADMHHIVLRRSGSKYVFVYASALFVLACAIYLYFLEEKSISLVYYSLLFDIILVKLLLRKPVNKESVVIMPAFGVQLETHYMSQETAVFTHSTYPKSIEGTYAPAFGTDYANAHGLKFLLDTFGMIQDFVLCGFIRNGKVIRCFVPIDKILKPVLLECVTPVTCYWTLSLIVRDESEMVLVFKIDRSTSTNYRFNH
ncbi:GPI-GlcNAc transferase complex PIG-H component [Trifolium pratense]|uniref:GPI-GlcNAc transferase complex PIG-H component n=1 Tax=Trifolium pratense TaxID=57577 RepID=A0A2K3MQJ1_TRIPR|nr:GPI-GlcNAc transferase complex PIG-H component [Trifolium pratense]